jgi:hypothetical protein
MLASRKRSLTAVGTRQLPKELHASSPCHLERRRLALSHVEFDRRLASFKERLNVLQGVGIILPRM